MNRAQQNQRQQRGISLYTLLAAVVVLGVLTSVLVTSFTGTHSKGTALWALMQNVGQAANRFHLDTSCYNTELGGLWVYSIASTHNTCGATIPQSMWHGPYMKQMELQSATEYGIVSQFGPNAVMSMEKGGVKINGMTPPTITVSKVAPDIAQAAFEACGGKDSACRLNGDKTTIHYFYADEVP